jgi:hypothetical protein
MPDGLTVNGAWRRVIDKPVIDKPAIDDRSFHRVAVGIWPDDRSFTDCFTNLAG